MLIGAKVPDWRGKIRIRRFALFFTSNIMTGKMKVFPDLEELETAALLLSGHEFASDEARKYRRFGEMIAKAIETKGAIKVLVRVEDCPESFSGEKSIDQVPQPLQSRIRLTLQFFVVHYGHEYRDEHIRVFALK